jgi:hypothetical protein
MPSYLHVYSCIYDATARCMASVAHLVVCESHKLREGVFSKRVHETSFRRSLVVKKVIIIPIISCELHYE